MCTTYKQWPYRDRHYHTKSSTKIESKMNTIIILPVYEGGKHNLHFVESIVNYTGQNGGKWLHEVSFCDIKSYQVKIEGILSVKFVRNTAFSL